MNSPKPYFIPGILLFTISILAAGFSQFYPDMSILVRINFLAALVYLGMGWWIFRFYFPAGNPLLLFFMGFFYSSVLMAAVFCSAEWPLYSTIAYVALLWAGAVLLLVSVQKKLMTREAFTQFMIEGILLLVLAVLIVIKS